MVLATMQVGKSVAGSFQEMRMSRDRAERELAQTKQQLKEKNGELIQMELENKQMQRTNVELQQKSRARQVWLGRQLDEQASKAEAYQAALAKEQVGAMTAAWGGEQ